MKKRACIFVLLTACILQFLFCGVFPESPDRVYRRIYKFETIRGIPIDEFKYGGFYEIPEKIDISSPEPVLKFEGEILLAKSGWLPIKESEFENVWGRLQLILVQMSLWL